MARRRPTSAQQPLEQRILLTATLCLLAAGAVMVYSASSARTLLQGQGDGTAYLIKYLIYGGLGLVAMQALARLGLDAVRRATGPLLVTSFVLLVAVKVPHVGIEVNAAATFERGTPRTLFRPRIGGPANRHHYTVARDGQRFGELP